MILQNIYIPFLEIASLTLCLFMLYWLRRAIGIIPIYLLLGLFFIFSQILLLPSINSKFIEDGQLGTLSCGMLLIPVVLMYLIIYEEEGTLEAQRFILGLLMGQVGFIYITQLVIGQFSFGNSEQIPEIIRLLADSSRFTAPLFLITFVHLILLLLLPVGYQLLRNLRVPCFFALLLHICAFVLLSNLAQRILPTVKPSSQLFHLRFALAWIATTAGICALAQLYLNFNTSSIFNNRRPLGILTSLYRNLQSLGHLRQAVEEWEGRYQAVFDNTTELLLLTTSKGLVLNANRAALNILGSRYYNSGMDITKLLQTEDHIPFAWENAWQSLCQTTDKSPSPINTPSLLMAVPDQPNSFRNIECTITRIRLNDTDLAFLIMHDTTKSKKAEEERKQLEEELLHSQRLEDIGVLAGGVAHDFNNLLLSMQSSAELLSREPLPPKCHGLLSNINIAITRASDLINKLLGFARQGKYQEEVLDMKYLAQQAVDLFKVGTKNIDFHFMADPDSLMFKGDATQIQQVILNLLINSRDALSSEPGAIRKITLRIDHAQEDMPAWKRSAKKGQSAEDYLLVRVKDTGSGMSRETQNSMFEPFFTTKGTKGSGLGLSMAYGCIQHHQGWIDVDSELGKGCEINIFLPLYKGKK